MGRHKLIKDESQEEVVEAAFNDGENVQEEPQEEVVEAAFNDGENVQEEPQEEVVKIEEKSLTHYRGTGRFEYKLSENGSYFVLSPEGKMVTPMDLTEEKAKDLVFRFNK